MPHTSICCVWGLSAWFVINTNPKWRIQETYWFFSQEINEYLTVILLLLTEREFQRKIILCVLCSVAPVVSDSVQHCNPPGSSLHGIFQGKNTGVGILSFLQGIFLTQGSTHSISCIFCITGRFFNTEPPGKTNCVFSSVQFSRSVVSDSLRPHEL